MALILEVGCHKLKIYLHGFMYIKHPENSQLGSVWREMLSNGVFFCGLSDNYFGTFVGEISMA
jgi:hypothetical protein